MRILWVNVGGLWPLHTGGRHRSFHIVAELARRHSVSVFTTHGSGDDPRGLSDHLPSCERVVSVPHAPPKRETLSFASALLRSWFSPLPVNLWRWRVPALQGKVARVLATERPDLVIADFLHALPNVPAPESLPLVLFEHNVEHLIWKRLWEAEKRLWRRTLLEVEWRKMRRYEVQAAAQARLTIAVSEPDRALLMESAPGARVAAVATGVDTVYFKPNGMREAPAALVFTGSMDWYPNEDAILYFIDMILPRIRARVPEAGLTVVGRNPSERLLSRARQARVEVTGTVDDVRPYVARGAISVVPLRLGGGTRLKIFEAMAMAKAVVSTPIGAEGLPLVPGKHFVAADGTEEFARAVVDLLEDPVRRRALGASGRRLVEERFSWRRVAKDFEAKCEEAIEYAH